MCLSGPTPQAHLMGDVEVEVRRAGVPRAARVEGLPSPRELDGHCLERYTQRLGHALPLQQPVRHVDVEAS